MGRVPITVMGYHCERCTHEWIPKSQKKEPNVCPKCKSPYWDKPRRKAMMTYEDFKDKIESTLKKAGTLLTWTEIRTKGRTSTVVPQ